MLEKRTCNRLPNQYFATNRKTLWKYVTNSDAEFVLITRVPDHLRSERELPKEQFGIVESQETGQSATVTL